MAEIGIPVPPGFALPVEVCEEYYAGDRHFPEWAHDQLALGIAGARECEWARVRVTPPPAHGLGPLRGRGLDAGDHADDPERRPLPRDRRRSRVSHGEPPFRLGLLSPAPRPVRRGRPGARPGRDTGSSLREAMEEEGVPDEAELDTASFRALAGQYERVHAELGTPFPSDAVTQLRECTVAVLESWGGGRAEAFRRLGMAGGARGTAVTVQAMVFGNLGAASGAGVAFTRNPWSGEPALLLDFRFGAQGEEVVSGEQSGLDQDAFARVMPEQYEALGKIGTRLERHYGDMQDLEFTIEEGRLFILQSRTGKRSPIAALRIAVDLVREGLIESARGARPARRDRSRRDQDSPRGRGGRAARCRYTRLRGGGVRHDRLHRRPGRGGRRRGSRHPGSADRVSRRYRRDPGCLGSPRGAGRPDLACGSRGPPGSARSAWSTARPSPSIPSADGAPSERRSFAKAT